MRRRRAAVVLALVAAVLVAVVALVAGPGVVRNLATTVADGDASIELTSGDAKAVAPVPAGWAVTRLPWEGDRATLRSPDGVLELDLRLASDAGASTGLDPLAAAAGLAGAPAAVSSESLEDGMTWRHADVDASLLPKPDADPVVAFLAEGAAAAPGAFEQTASRIGVTARTARDRSFADYRTAVAQVLGGITIGAGA